MSEIDAPRILQKLVDSPNNRCFACGPHNPHGLHLYFEQLDGKVCARFSPGEWHEGWEGVVHGGILATLLDEAMAYTLYFAGIKGVTARMELRYRAAIQQGDELTVEAWVTREQRRLVDVEGHILRADSLVAEASARFMKVGSLES